LLLFSGSTAKLATDNLFLFGASITAPGRLFHKVAATRSGVAAPPEGLVAIGLACAALLEMSSAMAAAPHEQSRQSNDKRHLIC
jgi:hypothetical protein